MSINPKTPWHKASYDQFLSDSLPQLLAERLPLAGYQVIENDPAARHLHGAGRADRRGAGDLPIHPPPG